MVTASVSMVIFVGHKPFPKTIIWDKIATAKPLRVDWSGAEDLEVGFRSRSDWGGGVRGLEL